MERSEKRESIEQKEWKKQRTENIAPRAGSTENRE
jgi:hypothetical protein